SASDLDTDGSFSVEMTDEGVGLVAVADASGQVVLLGYVDTTADDTEVSSRSTAMAMLYFALGGLFREGELQERMVELLTDDPIVDDLATELEVMLAADPAAIADGSEELVEAVLAARDAIYLRDVGSSQTSTAAPSSTFTFSIAADGTYDSSDSASFLEPLQAGSKNFVLITDAGERAGIDLLLADSGVGVYAKNSKRRPARLYLYRTGITPVGGSYQDVDPVQVGEYLSVPPSNQLSIVSAVTGSLGAIFRGAYQDTPLAPVYSEPIELPLQAGTSKTHYTAVLLAPDLSSDVPPVFLESRFFGEREAWDRALLELQFETWWSNILLPVISNFAFGAAVGKGVDYGKVEQTSKNVLQLLEPVFAGNGITSPLPISGDRARAMVVIMEDLANQWDSAIYNGLRENARNALGIAPRPSMVDVDARAFTSALAKAGGVMIVVSTLLTSADIVAVLSDMASNPKAETWNPVRVNVGARITPQHGEVSFTSPSATFEVDVDDPPAGESYLYRWSTSGSYGTISDFSSDDVLTLDTVSASILYLANDPVSITDDLHDTIRVEVYLDDGSSTIGSGSTLVAEAVAAVGGVDDTNTTAGRFGVLMEEYDKTTPFRTEHHRCALAYVAFEDVPGATSYQIRVSNYGPHPSWGTSEELQFTPNYQPPGANSHCSRTFENGELYLSLVGMDHVLLHPGDEEHWQEEYDYWIGSFGDAMVVRVKPLFE
ncbi:MAG TPA: hypothetical protein VFN03_07590, partial [Trueperaceae bacterium]|nr:hypothetical protein [Trueperaceae bacterium]